METGITFEFEDVDCGTPPTMQPTGPPVEGIPEASLLAMRPTHNDMTSWGCITATIIAYLALWAGVFSVASGKLDLGASLVIPAYHGFILSAIAATLSYRPHPTHIYLLKGTGFATCVVAIVCVFHARTLSSWSLCLTLCTVAVSWMVFVFCRKVMLTAHAPLPYQPVSESSMLVCQAGVCCSGIGYIFCWIAIFSSLAGSRNIPSVSTVAGSMAGGVGTLFLLFSKHTQKRIVNKAALLFSGMGLACCVVFCALLFHTNIESEPWNSLGPALLVVELGTGVPTLLIAMIVNRTGRVLQSQHFPAGLAISSMMFLSGYGLVWCSFFSMAVDAVPGDVTAVSGLVLSSVGWLCLSASVCPADRKFILVFSLILSILCMCCSVPFMYISVSVISSPGPAVVCAGYNGAVFVSMWVVLGCTLTPVGPPDVQEQEGTATSNVVPQLGVVVSIESIATGMLTEPSNEP
eukprot:TRINITY_DN3571_c1_g1_i1.p1 TRINITY_DN3571_c1_g1~~TRINITY_DN3571_c1_g1_i1.p1  ORF type:complete len:463 (+),score=56.57 TRINITY_DN3571_c1_g1_i1:67-1455(+)